MKIRLLSILCILLMSLSIEAQTEEFETASEAVKNIKVGWNYAFALDGTGAEEEYAKTWESAWVWGKENAASMIKMLRKAGFNAIRVPVSWRCFMDDEGKVDPKWMKHVRECVDFVIDQGMYCIINTHLDAAHQGHWLVADEDVYNNVKGRFEYLWIQIAEEFKDYDHHLLFEGYNEMLDKYGSWCFPSLSAPNGYDEDYARSAHDALTKYEQSFVNAVRSTGGNNEKRNLVLNTYAGTIGAHWDWSEHLMDPLIEMKLPTDKAKNHLIIGVHAYYDVNEYYWAKEDVDQAINDIKTYLIPKGVPVIIGEWGSGAGEDLFYKYPKSVLRFVQYFMEQMKANDDIAAFLWTGPVTQNNYANLPAFIEKEFIEALTKGYYRETYEPELLLADDYDVWIPFTPDNQYCWVWLSGIETGGNSGMQVELEEYPGDSKLSICFVCDKGDIYQPITSASSYFDFSTSIYGYEVRGVLLKYNGDTPCDIKIKRFVIDYKDGNKRSFNVAPDIGRHNPKEWSGPNFESKRKQFVHTVEYDGIWAELNIFSDDIPLKLKNYKGIRVEFAEPINVDDFIIKVYADNGAIAEGRAPNSSISTTLLFSDFNVNDVINRVTLQYCKEGKAKTKVVSAWLIRQDGTEEYSDLSPFWGCEIKEKTPYKAAASKEASNVTDQYIVNPSFNSDLHGWTNTGGTAKWKENTWEALNNYCEFEWTGGPVTNQKVVQTITLPAGNYRLNVTCASDPGSSGLYLFAGSYSKEMPGTGGVGSFSLDFIVAKESAITIGMKVENTTATWVNFDNFKLERLESTTDIHGISTTPTKNNTVIYNLWGQKLAKPQKGINIINGKKVLVK